MAKLTYLQLTNRVLKRIGQSVITDVTAATGQALIITELLNEAQNELWSETTNWYSLYKLRTFTTVTYTASTIAFNNADPDTITDTASGMGSFAAGQTVIVNGSTSNDGVYVISTAAAGTLTLQTADSLTAEAAGDSVTITAITYAVASDWGRTIDLVDITNNRILTEDTGRAFDESDPDMSSTSDPSHFTVEAGYYRLFYPVSSAAKIVDRYWKSPTALAANGDYSDLPQFCENFLIHWSWKTVLEYKKEFEIADRVSVMIYGNPARRDPGILHRARVANQKILDKMHIFSKSKAGYGIEPPRFPSTYGAMTWK